MDAAELISRQLQQLRKDYKVLTVTAAELEFYLIGSDMCPSLPSFWQGFSNACHAASIRLFKTEKETGHEQYEVALAPSTDPVKTAKDILNLKTIIARIAVEYGMSADFSAKPFADQPGSGLHIHINLAEKNGKNIFFKNDDTICAALQFCIGGLMTWVNPCMAVFAPYEDSYDRFKAKSNGPRTVSWGGNNRTVAIRLPDTAQDNKRIEHRVAGADADPHLVMAVLLAAMHYGIKNQCDPGKQIFGDAALPEYNLPPIITSRGVAVARLRGAALFEGYFTPSDLLQDH